VKFTKRIQFGLTPWLWRRLRKEAEQQKVSVNKLVRTAVEKQLGELIWQRIEAGNLKPSRGSKVCWTRLWCSGPEKKRKRRTGRCNYFETMTSNTPQPHVKETQST
jgi:hypothetical protein